MKRLIYILVPCLLLSFSYEHTAHLLWGPTENVIVTDEGIIAVAGGHLVVMDHDLNILSSTRIHGRIAGACSFEENIRAITQDGSVVDQAGHELFSIPCEQSKDIAATESALFAISDSGLFMYSDRELEWLDTGEYSVLEAGADIVAVYKDNLRLLDALGSEIEDMGPVSSLSDISIDGDRLAIVRGWMYADIYDVSDPYSPELLATINPSNMVTNCALSGDRLALTGVNGDIWKYDISELPTVEPYEYIHRPCFFMDVAWSGDNILVASLYDGLLSFGTTIAQRLTPAGVPSDFIGSGEYIYCAFGTGGIVTIDMTGSIVSRVNGEYISCLQILDSYMYAVDEVVGLLVYDISSPASPDLISVVEMSSRSNSLELVQSLAGDYYLYLLDFHNDLNVISLANPLAPRIVWTTDVIGMSPSALDQIWDLLAVTTLNSVEFYDNLFFPVTPRWMNRVESDAEIKDVAGYDDILVIATTEAVDIYRLGYTVPFGTRLSTISGDVTEVALDDSLLLLLSDWGISVYDITIPEFPLYLATIDIPASCAMIADGTIFTGSVYDGIDIITWGDGQQFRLNPGWNLVGIPYELDDLPHSDVGIFSFSSDEREYQRIDDPIPGEGYFWFADYDFSAELTTELPDTFDLNFSAGWNIVTVTGSGVRASLLPAVGEVYRYNNASGNYESADMLLPGMGYWVLMERETGVRIMGNTIEITYLGRYASNTGGTSPPPNTIRPDTRELPSVYPNPFNASACIDLDLTGEEMVVVELYGIDGRKAMTCFSGELPCGKNLIRISDNNGLPSGVYLLRISIGDSRTTRKIVLSK